MGQFTGILLLFHVSNNMEGRAHLQLMQQLGRNGNTYPTESYRILQKVSSVHGF